MFGNKDKTLELHFDVPFAIASRNDSFGFTINPKGEEEPNRKKKTKAGETGSREKFLELVLSPLGVRIIDGISVVMPTLTDQPTKISVSSGNGGIDVEMIPFPDKKKKARQIINGLISKYFQEIDIPELDACLEGIDKIIDRAADDIIEKIVSSSVLGVSERLNSLIKDNMAEKLHKKIYGTSRYAPGCEHKITDLTFAL